MKALLLTAVLTTASLADEAALLGVLEKHCASCHREDETPVLHGGINLAALRAEAGEAAHLLERVTLPDNKKGRMPKSKGSPGDPGYVPPLTAEEIALVKAWAEGTESKPKSSGQLAVDEFPVLPAERAFIPLKDEIKAIAADLAQQEARLQSFARYLSLANLYNLRNAQGHPTESDTQMDLYRAAVFKLINSVSRGSRIVLPAPVDKAKTLYRIDIRDYGWSAQDWETYVAPVYPYALRGIDVRAENEIAKLTGSAVTWLRADWFVFTASQPPLYHDLLKLPETEQALEHQLGVDTLANLRAGRAIRAGFRQSGVSQGNRLIERHEAAGGMYWKSYDFTPLQRQGGHDLFRSPLGPTGAGLTRNSDREFHHDGGEIIFTLPNGLHGYLLATSDGKRIDRGPTEIVQDKKRPDGAIINGISCMACHHEGVKQHQFKDGRESSDLLVDEMKKIVLAAGLDRDETHLIEDLHPGDEALHKALKADEQAYAAALKQTFAGRVFGNDPVSVLYNRFKKDVTLETLPAEFGEQDPSFLQRLKYSRDADMESIAAQFQAGLGFPRASWLDQFRKITDTLAYTVRDYQSLAYAEFTSSNAKVGGHEGRAPLADGGSLRISTDKSHYVAGEKLTVRLHVSEGMYVRLYHKSADNQVAQIFPNRFRTDNFVRGGEAVRLPGPGDAFEFTMSAPFGTEIIQAIASPVQFSDLEHYQPPVDGSNFTLYPGETDFRQSRRRGTKGLVVTAKLPVTSHATASVPAHTVTRPAPQFEARAVYRVSER
jgi:hypothetical protein